jgi:recombination DNA repair RAD52 pathway protein
MSNFNAAQTEQLLKPISGQRVLRDAKGHSHVSQQDVTAHLIRVFGFGGFDTEVLDVQCVFERKTLSISKGKQEPDPHRYDVCYRALLRLSVKDETGRVVAQYEDGSTATAQNQTQGDAHDLAYKSALSLSKKRAAINLGDQFGLSLYNKGQTDALVRGTLIKPDADDGETPASDLQDGVPRQVSLGNDEIEMEDHSEPDVGQYEDPQPYHAALAAATTRQELDSAGAMIAAATLKASDRQELRAAYTEQLDALKATADAP